jgi:hypothetical protein
VVVPQRFVGSFVNTTAAVVDETVLAWVDWRAAVGALESGRSPCSRSEAQSLRIAGSIAEGVPVDLGDALTGLDEGNLRLVADAVLGAGGCASVAVVAGGERR